MGEFVIAVLIVSLLWVMWDAIKLALKEKGREETAAALAAEPGRERLESFADSFLRLADTFSHLPCKKERLNEGDIQGVFREVKDRVCQSCEQREVCWQERYQITYRKAYGMLSAVEEEGEDLNPGRKAAFLEYCAQGEQFLDVLEEGFRMAKLNLLWSNRMMENRRAVAEQLYGTAEIFKKAASAIYDIKQLDEGLYRQLEVRLGMHGILLKEAWGLGGEKKGRQVFLTVRARRNGRCIPTKEVGALISEIYRQPMIPDQESCSIVNKEYSTILFVEQPQYYMLNGVARMTKDGELVSGDNFTLFRRENGQMIMSLSDGMGSGVGACQESETVIELLEQFLYAGFGKETAVRMIHSVMTLQNSGTFSTVDLCVTDLYSGVCEVLKIGASTTFFKHQGWVEAVASTSLPMGILQNIDYDDTKKQLQSGDFIIMVSDGILDALPSRHAEEIIKDFLLEQETDNARELAEGLLAEVLQYRQCRAFDDMTVLVGGLWSRQG